jgi:NADPH:quinone reductase-like Zn-dependent oxidoreductase
MEAIVYSEFGSTENFKLQEVEKPGPKDNEVLIKIHAASINSWDWDMVCGRPLLYRLLFGLFKPKYNIIGCDVAGTVEATGKNVSHLKVGDEVFGDVSPCGFGAFAEYVCASENLIALKPINASFEEAAAIPQGAVLALQSLNHKADLKPGNHILINGAGGCMGPFVLQLAKLKGVTVTCVDAALKLNMLSTLGADHVIDYMQEDFTKNGKLYDLIIEPVANRSIFEYKNSLAPNGNYVIVGGKVRRIFQTLFVGSLISMFTNRKMRILAHRPNTNDLYVLKELFEAGKLKSIIDKTFPLHEIPKALQYYGSGNAIGKVVITV